MPEDGRVPDLTFPDVERGNRETAWDLQCLLYEGGARASTSRVSGMIISGQLGKPLYGRLGLVTRIHEVIHGKLVGGGSAYTADNFIRFMRKMFSWAEDANHPLDLESIQKTYLHWTDSLVHRCRVIKDISQNSAYTMGAHTGHLLDAVLFRPTPLLSMTRLRMPAKRKTARGVLAEKQNLAETFAFGLFLQDICDGLPVDIVMNGSLPVRIPLRSGAELVEWSGYPNPKAVSHHLANAPETSRKGKKRRNHRKSLEHFKRWEADGTLRTRYPLVNRRCEAELLMFIGQTGMNFAQAHKLTLRHFFYASYLDGYQVRDRKARRGGEVFFEIFKEYKPHFERYLAWRRQVFPDSDALFPFVRRGGRTFQKHPQFALRTVCKSVGLRFVPPQELRNTRVTWLLRRSGNADLTASMAQHAKQTLLGVYERPSQQRAIGEVIRFWAKQDPALAITTPVAPGQCDGFPVPSKTAPRNTPAPDCIRPSGCLWCEHHRDIDRQDYVWSLASFRHLKIIELSKWQPPPRSREIHPAQHVIDRISEKLRWFRDSNARRRGWMEEALARVDEGNYHPEWTMRIAAMEGTG
jgi:integrase